MIFDGHSDIWYDVVARRESGERNVFDTRHYERLKKGKVEGGFVSCDSEKYTADELARHVEHLVNIMDVHHVGFGFDFTEFYPDNNKEALKALDPDADISCFGSIALDGLQSAAEIPLFVEMLRKVGFNEKEVEGIMRENWLKFIEKVVG